MSQRSVPSLLLSILGPLVLGTTSAAAQEPDEPVAVDDRLQRADVAFRGGDDATALSLLEELRGENLQLEHVHRLLAQVYHRLDRDEEARESISEALGQGRWTEDVLTLLVHLEQQNDRGALALHGLRALVLIAPGNPAYQLLLADTLEREGILEEALAVYAAMSRRAPSSTELEIRKAHLLLRLDRTADAREGFERAWWLGRQGPELSRRLARLWKSSFMPGRALIWYERADALDPDEGFRMEWASLALGQDDEATAQRLAGELRESEDAAVRGRAEWLLGQIAQRQGDDDASLKHWSTARADGFSSPAIDRFLGGSYYRRDRFAEAIPLLLASIEAGADPDTLDKMIRALIQEGRVDEARPRLAQWLEEFGPGDRQRAAVAVWQKARRSE